MNRVTTLLALLVASGCGGQVGEETIVCKAIESVALEVATASPLGFSAADVHGSIEGVQMTSIDWADDQSATATLSLAYDGGEIWYEDREWQDDGDSLAEIAGDCDDVVTIEMTASLSTDDGRLDESWNVVTNAYVATQASFALELDDIAGSLDPATFAPDEDYDDLKVLLDVTVSDGDVTGTVFGQSSGTSGDTAFASNFLIGEIGADEL